MAQSRMIVLGASRCCYFPKDYERAIALGEMEIKMSRQFSGAHKLIAQAHLAGGNKKGALRSI
jgi:hypothetical protein